MLWARGATSPLRGDWLQVFFPPVLAVLLYYAGDFLVF